MVRKIARSFGAAAVTIAVAVMCAVISIFGSQAVFAKDDCGQLANRYGPYDYTNQEHKVKRLPVVERAHFTPVVERLERGSTGLLADDLDYTLRAFPNHHRALYAMAKYQIANGYPLEATYYSADCYFHRAIRFKPDDGIVWMLYGIYKHKVKKHNEALEKYKSALKLMANSAELNYNVGLLYADMQMYDQAAKHAREAYKLKFPLPGLRNLLKEKGYWKKGE